MSAGAEPTVDRPPFESEPADEPLEAPDFEPTRRSLRFQPGLEGLRGLAVAAVLVFHGGFAWASGGFLGVSTFFTLSGYLITSLLLIEHSSTGRISLRQFWGRRFRRLMPASLLCLAFIVLLFAPLVATNGQLDTLRGDVISALAYVANWHFVITGQSYQQLFTAPSPLLHFWSLAIEEQFYVLFPLAMSLFLVRFAMRRKALAWVLGGLAVLSTIEMAILYNPVDTSRVYYGTDTRAAELLLGALLAVLMTERRRIRTVVRSTGAIAGVVALAAVVWLWHAAQQGDGWLYHGGFGVYALLSCTIVFAATQRGLARDFLSIRFLRWLGRISYGVYLLHWPIFLWVDQALPDLNDYVSFAFKIAITFTVAVLSLRFVEAPIRERRILTNWQPLVAAPAAIALIVAGTLITTSDVGVDRTQLAFADAGTAQLGIETFATAPASQDGAGSSTASTAPAGPVHALLFGDSLANTLVGGLTDWAPNHPDVVFADASAVGCSIGVGGMVGAINEQRGTFPFCDERLETWPDQLKASDVDYVVAISCLFDVADRKMPGDDEWRAPGDPVLDQWLEMSINNAVATMSSSGAKVVWLTCPYVDPQYNSQYMKAPGPYAEADHTRTDRWNEIIRTVGASNPNMVVVELPPFLDETWPDGQQDRTMRPDGVHFSIAAAGDILSWLEPQLTSGDLRDAT